MDRRKLFEIYVIATTILCTTIFIYGFATNSLELVYIALLLLALFMILDDLIKGFLGV